MRTIHIEFGTFRDLGQFFRWVETYHGRDRANGVFQLIFGHIMLGHQINLMYYVRKLMGKPSFTERARFWATTLLRGM